MGDAAVLAELTGLPVAHDFRSADVAAGGQGAPLVPVFHAALAAELPKPLAVLNLGGVGNVTWIGADGALVAFDTGPANGPLDDWARRHTGAACDWDGALAAAGRAAPGGAGAAAGAPLFRRAAAEIARPARFRPRAAGIGRRRPAARGRRGHPRRLLRRRRGRRAPALPGPPREWLVGGGGRRNAAAMRALRAILPQPVRPVEAVGWDGDALEAQAFGVLAARVARGLPLTFPGTTGAPSPLPGGRLTGRRRP